MKHLMSSALACALLLLTTHDSLGSIVTTLNPGGTSEIGARIRWGATGFEGSVYDSSPFNQNPTLNPSGAPVWQLNVGYGFAVTFASATGELSLSVDFNDNGTFEANETIRRSAFAAPGATSYAGQGFNYLSISGNESGRTTRSQVTNLMINGDSQTSIVPNGTFDETFYVDMNGDLLTDISITGDLTFTEFGTASQERPSWNFVFLDAQAVVPEASTIAIWSVLASIGLAAYGRRR